MASGLTAYPTGLDTFEVPNAPSATPLSQAGTGNSRSHVALHADVGSAVMALEVNASQITHDHSGANSSVAGAKLAQANTHQLPDTDVSVLSLHHTIDPTQSSPLKSAAANHSHSNYVDLTSTQNVSGKKNFPSGANAITIPDFSNAAHGHTRQTGDGGVAASTGYFWSQISSKYSISPNSTQDFFIGAQGFTIPAFMAVVGTIFTSYLVKNGQGNGNHSSQSFQYLSYHLPSDTGTWISNKSILFTNATFNGNMVETDYSFTQSNDFAEQFRANTALGFYIPQSASVRTGVKLGYRIVNADNTQITELNWGGYCNFLSLADQS